MINLSTPAENGRRFVPSVRRSVSRWSRQSAWPSGAGDSILAIASERRERTEWARRFELCRSAVRLHRGRTSADCCTRPIKDAPNQARRAIVRAGAWYFPRPSRVGSMGAPLCAGLYNYAVVLPQPAELSLHLDSRIMQERVRRDGRGGRTARWETRTICSECGVETTMSGTRGP
jgi:hypothetical protein